ncbi:class I SAM-dependent methyltransferase [Desulfosediminicola flagellatus]|uniref:class I SAM-dependent methyltransferase n=1 Tax=Desulfosediminicola flagellatus TaxID=2569541 RepID=UPI0010ACDBCF|nr:class I SAM-dependent methyltransferase [Desulfosediminicola flagellatus]
MNINTLIKTVKKPEAYTPGTAMMWVDEHISKQLLATHLSQDIELASRKETTIASTIEWILSHMSAEMLNILDMGCGPGLYAEQLAARGHNVTGMDFSQNSITYAKESARRKNLDISYVVQNYLELSDENRYDLIMMIFTDFGVLTPDQREIILANIYRALKPGGTFVFDVLNENHQVSLTETREWEASESGFWRNSHYLALTETFYYEEHKVSLSQHTIIEDNEKSEVYRFWVHTFTHSDLDSLLSNADFKAIQCYEKVIPDSDLYSSDSVTFCIARK